MGNMVNNMDPDQLEKDCQMIQGTMFSCGGLEKLSQRMRWPT